MLLKPGLSIMLRALNNPQTPLFRYIATRKRFYRRCSVLKSNGSYEIALDQRKLKTPRGNVFKVDNEPLAIAVATEWDSQKNNINQGSMHLTGLCCTVLDNPNHLTKEAIVDELVDYLESDTILFPSAEEGELFDLQKSQWGPVISWLCNRYDVNVEPSRDISGPKILDSDKEKLRRHLLSYNIWAVTGFRFVIEALKSVTLGLACVERVVTVQQATKLSRLEEEFQANRWGRVEWCHDLNEQDTQARVAAGVLFVQCSSSKYLRKEKVQAS